MSRRTLRQVRDDTGLAMLQVVMIMMVVAMVSVATLGAVVGEVLPTAHERARTRSLSAAQAGLQAGLAVVRAARTTLPGVGEVGDPEQLPCLTWQSPLWGSTGAVQTSDTGSATGYAVRIRYYLDDPAVRSDAWRDSNQITCTAGAGAAQAPYYALVESAAAAMTGGPLPAEWADRAVELVYAFNRTDAGRAGGPVRVGAYSYAVDLCWEAASTSPAEGSQVALRTCDATSAAQQWSFRDDYSVVLAGTQSAAAGAYDGMCLTAEPTGRTDRTDHAARADDATPASAAEVSADLRGPVAGSATAFSGAGSWLRTSTAWATPGATTVSAWFRSAVRSGTIIGFGGDAGTAATTPDRLLWLDATGRLVWGVSPADRRTVSSTGSYADDRWHHVAASVGPAGTRLYVDGALVASDPAWTTAGTAAGYWHLGWGGQLAAGWVQAPTNPYWQGSLAHVATWAGQLPDSQVAALATAPDWATTASLVAGTSPQSYWPLGGSWRTLDAFLATCDGGSHQKWAYNDGGRLEVERFDGVSLSGVCLDAGPAAEGVPLSTRADCRAALDWNPSSTVGAGAAGEPTGQLVNYGEYGRCLDVTNQRVDWPYLIDYPCKADPTRPVLWNQRIGWDAATGQLSVVAPAGRYCLRSPDTSGGRVLAVHCSTTAPEQRWTRHGAGDSRSTAYTVVDAVGRCLGLGPPGASTGGLAQWSTIVVEPCDGSRTQKWNAPPQLAGAQVDGERETTLNG